MPHGAIDVPAQSPRTLHQIESEITELAAHIHAATYRLLELVREFDEREGWGGPGLKSCAHWLNWKCGIGLGAAREKVRVAHALKNLPEISDAFRRGMVSFSKVRAMTRVAMPENEEYLLMIARHGTASHVEHLVRQFRKVKRIEALEHENRRHMLRELNWHIDDDGSYVIRARLTPEQGERVVKALEAACDENDSEVGASEQLCAGATVPLRDALVCFGERGLVVPNKRAKTQQRARKGPSRRVSPEKPHLARCDPRP
ncbi:MAG: DUF222 domain-containing protein [Wenzhouxiangellaceae bacterium]|nr:DUF222 domain-containing protein [Wenzhouxiangellaceae bacterium]